MLGVSANGNNEPDFAGYEVKAMTVSQFGRSENKVVTVITPEPDIGVYQDASVLEFLERWGYADKKGRPDRRNFGGIYRVGTRHKTTELTLTLTGYDPTTVTDSIRMGICRFCRMMARLQRGGPFANWSKAGLASMRPPSTFQPSVWMLQKDFSTARKC